MKPNRFPYRGRIYAAVREPEICFIAKYAKTRIFCDITPKGSDRH